MSTPERSYTLVEIRAVLAAEAAMCDVARELAEQQQRDALAAGDVDEQLRATILCVRHQALAAYVRSLSAVFAGASRAPAAPAPAMPKNQRLAALLADGAVAVKLEHFRVRLMTRDAFIAGEVDLLARELKPYTLPRIRTAKVSDWPTESLSHADTAWLSDTAMTYDQWLGTHD